MVPGATAGCRQALGALAAGRPVRMLQGMQKEPSPQHPAGAACSGHPRASVCGSTAAAGMQCSPVIRPPGSGCLRAPAQGLRLQFGSMCPPRLPHPGATRMAEGCLKIAIHVHVNLLLSPHKFLLFLQNLMWGTWAPGKARR